MIVTEEEAKTKRCHEAFPAAYGLSEGGDQQGPIASMGMQAPMSFAGAGGGAAYAVYSQPHGGAPFHCIAGKCMAWEWRRNGMDEVMTTLDGTPLGYCGKVHR